MADTYAALVAESLGRMSSEAPACWQAVAGLLGATPLLVTIDAESFSVIGDPGLRVVPPVPVPAVRLAAPASTIAHVLDGQVTLDEAVISGELHVLGSLAHVVRAHDALIQFVHGAIRSTSIADLRPRLDDLAARAVA